MLTRLLPALALALLLAACADDTEPTTDAAGPDLPDATVDAPAAAETSPDAAADGPATDGPATDAQSCAPAPPAANLPLFTALQADLAQLTDPAKRQARVDAFIAAVEASAAGFPVRDAGSVVFLHQGAEAVSVAGSFNSWQPGAEPLQSFADTDLHYLVRQLAPAGQEYKLVTVGGTWLEDPLNPHVTWDGIAVAGPGAFNAVVPHWGAGSTDRMERLRVTSPKLGNTRDVFIYLPEGYDQDSCTRYPVLVVNDGNESITRSHFDQVARTTFAAAAAKPAILVFVALASQTDRMSEYSCDTADLGDEYTDFLCDTLLPLVDQRYRTEATPASRGIIGASLGGLIAYAALWWRNDCFRRAGAQSGSFWYKTDMMINRVKTAGPVTLTHAYLDNGTDNLDATHAMRDALKTAGHPVYHWENLAQDHTWDAWQDRFDEALTHLLPP